MKGESKKKKIKRMYELACRKNKEFVERKKRGWQIIKQKKAEAAQPDPAVIEKKKYHKETPTEVLATVHDMHFKRRVLERVHEDRFTDDDGVELLKLIIEYSIATGDARFIEEHQGVLKYQITIGGRNYIVVYSLRTERYVTVYPPCGYRETVA